MSTFKKRIIFKSFYPITSVITSTPETMAARSPTSSELLFWMSWRTV